MAIGVRDTQGATGRCGEPRAAKPGMHGLSSSVRATSPGEKGAVPGYFRLAELILDAINRRKKVLTELVGERLSTETRALLDELFVQGTELDGESVPSKTAAYKLTLLKKRSQSTKPSKVKERVSDLDVLATLYARLQPVLNSISLNHDGIHYYANSVIKAEIFQVLRRSEEDRYLHVIAFVAHQYYRLQDNLVDGLLSSLQSFHNSAQREHKEQCYVRRQQRNQSLKALVNCLDEELLGTLAVIDGITHDERLTDSEKIERIRTVLNARDPARRELEEELVELKRGLESDLNEEDYYEILETKSIRLQNRVAPVIKALTFQAEPAATELLVAIDHFKHKDGAIDKHAPLDFLDPAERAAVLGADQRFRVSLYKALLFRHVQSAIKSGTLNLEHSYKYRALDDYLIGPDNAGPVKRSNYSSGPGCRTSPILKACSTRSMMHCINSTR